MVKSVIENIPQEKGVYLWVKYETNGLWKNIYIGKSGDGENAGLQRRIGNEELKKWGPLFWLPVMGEENLIRRCREAYPTADNYWESALLKAGTTHIVWVSDPSCNERKLRDIELLLIGMFDPTANNQLVRTVEDAKDIKDKMKETLRGNEMRPRVMA